MKGLRFMLRGKGSSNWSMGLA